MVDLTCRCWDLVSASRVELELQLHKVRACDTATASCGPGKCSEACPPTIDDIWLEDVKGRGQCRKRRSWSDCDMRKGWYGGVSNEGRAFESEVKIARAH